MLEIGHLREVAEHYAFNDGADGAFRRLSDQISSVARRIGPGPFAYDFANVYNFEGVEYSHGDATVSGIFVGVAEDRGAMLAIRGDTTFLFSDEFKDPLDIDVEPGGTPYAVTGNWTASFSAEVFKQDARSIFAHEGAH